MNRNLFVATPVLLLLLSCEPSRIRDLKTRANAGDALAMGQLGNEYLKGEIVKKDLDLALQWFTKGANANDMISNYQLGAGCDEGGWLQKNFVAARKYYLVAANSGHMIAAYRMAFFLESGMGGEVDIPNAGKYYEIAATQGHAYAMTRLGHLYFSNGTRNDREITAFSWYLKAARNNDAEGMYSTAWCLIRGRGTAQDLNNGWQWMKTAAEQGSPSAMWEWAFHPADSIGDIFSLPERAEWVRRASNKGHVQAQKWIKDYEAGQIIGEVAGHILGELFK